MPILFNYEIAERIRKIILGKLPCGDQFLLTTTGQGGQRHLQSRAYQGEIPRLASIYIADKKPIISQFT
ncbi:hypothetical protein LY16_01487 [Xenorhabdus doucetiae]|uniref:Uncharacterized protein n=1 Tax=Xenorhabdus doucetiae TaxID=351671 RepID=A0ABY3NSS1_9GAMM|nr:hypothetical protein LY16_01487 [Xenorhabdus doucetiae]